VPSLPAVDDLWLVPRAVDTDRRPHMALAGAVPELIHAGQHWQKLPRTAKAIPARIERRLFPDTRVTAFRLAA